MKLTHAAQPPAFQSLPINAQRGVNLGIGGTLRPATALSAAKPLAFAPSHTRAVLSNGPFLRAAINPYARAPLSSLRALQQDGLEPESADDSTEASDKAKDTGTDDTTAADEESSCNYIQGEIKELISKYQKLFKQDVDNLVDTQLNLMYAHGTEGLQELDEKIQVFKQKIDDAAGKVKEFEGNVADSAQEVREWVGATAEFAQKNAPAFLTQNSTKVEDIESQIESKLEALKGQVEERLPINDLKAALSSLESMLKPLFTPKSDGNSTDAADSANSTQVNDSGNDSNGVD